jgi:two-component system response regulator HydG
MRAADLDIVELLDFVPAEGRIGLGEQRMLLWDADAFGNLRRELIENLGLEAARGILRRFGFANGYRDALSTRTMAEWPSDAEWWLTCPALQAHQGKVRPRVGALEIDRAAGHFALEVHWDNSYEADQHVRVDGPPGAPVCWTLAGYASGFSSAVMGEEVFVVEQECRAMGHTACRVVGKTRRAWGAEAARIAAEYKAPALARELEAREEELRQTASQLRRREIELQALRDGDGDGAALVTRSRAMAAVLDLVGKVAQVDANVLINGESGTGKEIVARGLHRLSRRASGPFVAINCAALPEPLLESELFGYARGAFTDARVDRAGLFSHADGGTLFLDEVGELPRTLQPKLLRALEERSIRPIGATAEVAVDVRVLAATHRDLAADVEAGRFRADLYYRLNALRLTLPPLRDRKDDIAELARHFARTIAAHDDSPARELTADALDRLRQLPWPGNVRELRNCIEHAVVLSGDQPKLAVEHLPAELRAGAEAPLARLLDDSVSLGEIERRYTLIVLERNRGSRSATARALGIGTNTLWRKLKQWGVPAHGAD